MSSQALQAHNNARVQASGGTRPSLTWSATLASHAQTWANHLAQIGNMQHASGIQQGENLYAGSGREYTFSDAVGAWVGEKTKYSGQSIPDGDFSSYGHYTQVIWPETTQVGMASAKGSNGWTYIVGRYLSPGNVSGQSAYRAGPTGPSAPPSSETQGGYYLVNSYKDGQASSGAAWYNHLGGNDGQRPQMYVNIKTDGVLTWEGNTHRATFPDGTTIMARVDADEKVKAAALYTKVGEATIGNKGHGLFKDRVRVLYEIDGWKVYCVYYG